jgi:hypothetical protein
MNAYVNVTGLWLQQKRNQKHDIQNEIVGFLDTLDAPHRYREEVYN